MAALDLEQHRVAGAARSMYFVPGFLSAEEEASLLSAVDSAPQPKWTTLRGRRLQQWGGVPGGRDGTEPMLEEGLPPWLQTLSGRLHSELRSAAAPHWRVPPNHVLVNEYTAGQGIMGHEDGPLYEPFVAIVNLASTLLLEVWPKGGSEERQLVVMEAGSLWVMADDLYSAYLHGIEAREEDSYRLVECPEPKSESDEVKGTNGERVRESDSVSTPDDCSGVETKRERPPLAACPEFVNWYSCSEQWRKRVMDAAEWDEEEGLWTARIPRERRVSLTVRRVKNSRKLPKEKLLAAIFGKRK